MTHGISWTGAVIVAGRLLERSKAKKADEESYASKMARDNFDERVRCVRNALNCCGGPTLAAASRLQHNFFTDVETAPLANWLVEIVNSLKTFTQLPIEAYGDLDFEAAKSESDESESEPDDEMFDEE